MIHENQIDKWFMRVKDVVIVFGIIIAFWGWGIKLNELPMVVDAQAKEIVQLKDTAASNKIRLERLEIALNYIANDIKEIKDSIKDTNFLVRQHIESSH